MTILSLYVQARENEIPEYFVQQWNIWSGLLSAKFVFVDYPYMLQHFQYTHSQNILNAILYNTK